MSAQKEEIEQLYIGCHQRLLDSHYLGLTATYSFGGKKVRHIRHDLNNSESKRAEKQ